MYGNYRLPVRLLGNSGWFSHLLPAPSSCWMVQLGNEGAALPHRGCDVIPWRCSCSLACWELFARVGGTPCRGWGGVRGDLLAWKVLGMNHLSWAWCHKQEHIVATLLIPGMLCPDLNLYSFLSLFKYIYIFVYVCMYVSWDMCLFLISKKISTATLMNPYKIPVR